MWEELQGHLRDVKNDHLRVLLNRIVADNEAQLRIWPAAQQIHHAYRGGFLEHIAKMAEVGRLIARAYGADEDLVIAGVVLHDIGKAAGASTKAKRQLTRDGNLVGPSRRVDDGREPRRHLRFPASSARRSNTLACTTGTRDYGSRRAKDHRGLILASVDELDAKLNQVRRAVKEDPSDDEFTSWNKRLGRVLYKGGVPDK